MKKRNLWPIAIIVYFVVFITGIVVWVSFAMRHDDQLVRPDYYEHEIKYQGQIDRIVRTRSLQAAAGVSYDHSSRAILLTLPRDSSHAAEGTVHLYRPSDARLDQKLTLLLNERGEQRIDTSALQGGLWKVLVTWQVGDQEFYIEKPLVI